MTDQEERQTLLARIATLTDLAISPDEPIGNLRWMAGYLERGSRIVKERGRLAAMCYGIPDDGASPDRAP